MLKEYTVVLQVRIDLQAEVPVYAEDEEDVLNMSWTQEELRKIAWRDSEGKLYKGVSDVVNSYDIEVIDVVPGKPRIRR